MTSNPTIVIIGGAFQTTEFFEPLKHALEAHGHPVELPALPTCSDIDRVELGKMTVSDDANIVQKEIETLISGLKHVVVIMHSYGSQVASSLSVKDLTTASRKEKGLPGGLDCFVWYASAAIPENVSFRQLSGGNIPDFDRLNDDGTYDFLIAGDTFLNELSQEDREKWTAKLIPQSQTVFDYSCADAAWKYVPNIVLLTENDKAIPASWQEMSVQSVNAQKVVRLSMGHGAHLAQTDELAKAICDAIKA